MSQVCAIHVIITEGGGGGGGGEAQLFSLIHDCLARVVTAFKAPRSRQTVHLHYFLRWKSVPTETSYIVLAIRDYAKTRARSTGVRPLETSVVRIDVT